MNGQTTRYYYDGANIIAEATVANGTATLKARYIRAGDRLIAHANASDTKSYYLHNGHGDVVGLANGSGNKIVEYSYDIWGKPITQGTGLEQPFRYSGEYWDNTTKLQYLRARWYDPSVGRFINEDTYEGDIANPLSLNLYTYVYNNPLKYVDPSGHCGVLPNGNFHDCNTVDTKLLQAKIDYSIAESGSGRNVIAQHAANLRMESGRYDEVKNPNGYTVLESRALDYYTIPDVTEKLNNLMLRYESNFALESRYAWPINLPVFYETVRNKAELDLKNLPDWQHSHFIYSSEILDKDEPGNISYGYFGKVLGIPDGVLIRAAGAAQIAADPKNRWTGFNFTNFGDDFRDTARIQQGITIYNEWHK